MTSRSAHSTGVLSTNGHRPKSQLIPTNSVTTKEGQTVRARIEASLPVADVIQQLCSNLKLPEPAAFYALRDENDELVTDENLRKKIRTNAALRIVNAPKLEAIEVIERFSNLDSENRAAPALRMTLFNLAKYIKEEEFASEFLRRDGLMELISIITSGYGNMLAYALTAMQNLMELDFGWSAVDSAFIFRVVQILSSPHSLINVCRPATAILKRLVEADPRSFPGPLVGSSSQQQSSQQQMPPGSVFRYGFDKVYDQMKREPGLLEIVVGRLASPDSVMALNSMMLINSLLSHVTDIYWEELTSELDRLSVRKFVISLMTSQSSHSEDLTSSLLDFQANYVRVIYCRKSTPVDPDTEPHTSILNFIWSSAKIDEDSDDGNEDGEEVGSDERPKKWSLIGFESEDLAVEFNEVGVLGLECLKSFALHNPDFFTKAIFEQNSRPPERRCLVVKASNEVVELLSDHWSIFAPGYSTSTTFQPFLLDFYKVHALATQFFLRMWNESGAAVGDFMRVAALVRSQIKFALRHESSRPWHQVPIFFLESEYREVRDRQMRELESEDDLLSKVPVRNLRAKLFKESYEFVKHQRLQCMMQGAWFMNGISISVSGSREATKRPARPWRFLRLDNTLKYLHYVDSPFKFQVRNGFEDLPERFEVSTIQEIAVNSCAAPPGVQKDPLDLPPPTQVANASPYSFSLLSDTGAIANQVATDASRWADWTDGLNMLRKDGGHVATQETAGFVHALTEIGLKIRLLDLSGEKVDIPSTLISGPPPPTTDFFFSDLYDSSP